MKTRLRFGAAALFVITLVGCAAPTTAPRLLSVSTVGGKGIPNGRSDSSAPFASLTSVSSMADFGFKPEHAVRVGNAHPRHGDAEEKLYLNALRGPNGEALGYERLGACCQFATPSGYQGIGLLDVFRISGLPDGKPVILYLNLYEPGPLELPQGFTARPH